MPDLLKHGGALLALAIAALIGGFATIAATSAATLPDGPQALSHSQQAVSDQCATFDIVRDRRGASHIGKHNREHNLRLDGVALPATIALGDYATLAQIVAALNTDLAAHGGARDHMGHVVLPGYGTKPAWSGNYWSMPGIRLTTCPQDVIDARRAALATPEPTATPTATATPVPTATPTPTPAPIDWEARALEAEGRIATALTALADLANGPASGITYTTLAYAIDAVRVKMGEQPRVIYDSGWQRRALAAEDGQRTWRLKAQADAAAFTTNLVQARLDAERATATKARTECLRTANKVDGESGAEQSARCAALYDALTAGN